MRYKAAEKREIIDLVENSALPVRRTLDRLGIPKSTFYGWYERYCEGGDDALVDGQPRSTAIWNRIPDAVRESILELALEKPELSARELAVRYTERNAYFVSESSVYRLLKAHDLITSPAFILMKAADRFPHPTTVPDQLWQTDFTYLKVMGWGRFYLSTVLDDYSRYILAWKLCYGMTSSNVRKLVARAGRAAELGFPAHPHMLRHACGYKLANDGHDTRALQHYLGHKKISHTETAPDRFKGFWRD
jgi:integrase